jgi:hypothetical protein
MDENPQSSTNNASSKSNLKGTLIEAFRVLKLSELITVLGIFVFIPGFIIVNVYLAGLGIHEHSLFRMKFLSAGFLFIALLAVYFFFVWRRIYYAEEDVGNIAITLIGGSTSKFSIRFWGILSMVIVYADNGFGIVSAATLSSIILFPSEGLKIIFGIFLLFFLIDYPLYKMGKYAKHPRITSTIACSYHVLSLFLFFLFVKGEEPRALFWTFLGDNVQDIVY